MSARSQTSSSVRTCKPRWPRFVAASRALAHLIAFHCRLQRVDGIDLRDYDMRAGGTQRARRPLADVAVARDDARLA